MKRVSVLLLTIVFAQTVSAFNGDMGLSTEPNTDGSSNYPYLIEDFLDFQAFISNSDYWASGLYTKLVNNIDLSVAGVYPVYLIGNFYGHFDGNNKAIQNLTISGMGYCALFRNVRPGATIKNLGLENTSVIISQVGGASLAIENFGTISNCYSTGSVQKSSSEENLSVLGGLVADNDGIINDCYSTCSVTGLVVVGGLVGENDSNGTVINSYSIGTITGAEWVGGLVADNYCGIILNSYSSSAVIGVEHPVNVSAFSLGGLVGRNYEGVIKQCYSTGSVSGGWFLCVAGGLIGENYSGGSVLNSYSSATVNGDSDIGGLVGRNSMCLAPVCLTDPMPINIIKNCYSSGAVTGSSTGGLVGDCYGYYAVTNCFWDVTTSGIGSEGDSNFGAIGKLTIQMQAESNFTDVGWDFNSETENGYNDIWHMPNGVNGTPMLYYQRDILGDQAGPYGVEQHDLSELSKNWQDIPDNYETLTILADNWLKGR